MLDNGVAVQFIHRWFAILTLAVTLLFGYSARQSGLPHSGRTIVGLLLLTVIAQVVLGIATLVLAVPISLGVLH